MILQNKIRFIATYIIIGELQVLLQSNICFLSVKICNYYPTELLHFFLF